MKSLKEKGLVDKQFKGKRHLYLASGPSSIALNLEARKNAINKILPDLRALYRAEKNKPTIKFYYGMQQFKELFARVDGAREILFVLPTDILFEAYPKFFTKFRQQLFKQGVMVRDILTQESGLSISKKTKQTMRGYYDYRLFAKKYEDMPTSIRIWNDNVALVTFDQPAFGTVITNQPLVKTFRVMFGTMWETGTL